MPAASHIEKDGHFTNTQRLLQWHDKALDPPGDARSELWFMHHLCKRVRAHYAGSDGRARLADRQPHVGLPGARRRSPSPTPRPCSRRSTATTSRPASPVPGFAELKADGSTACGCWIYSGCFADGVNQTRRRDPATSTTPRAAGSRPSGRGRGRPTAASSTTAPRPTPRASRGRSARSTSGGTRRQGKWAGYDVPDFPVDKAPDYRPDDDAKGMDAIGGADPFIMMADGKGWLYAPAGLLDGPMPTHYEPLESPVAEPLYPEVGAQPGGADAGTAPDNPVNPSPATRAIRSSPRPSGSPSTTRRAR